MAASAQLPRLSFGAGSNLDLSLNLPIVLLPPSSSGPRTDAESDFDDDDDKQSIWGLSSSKEPTEEAVKEVPNTDNSNNSRAPTPNTPGSHHDPHGTDDDLVDDEYTDDDLDDVDYGELRIATVATVPVPKIPDRDFRRPNNNNNNNTSTSNTSNKVPPIAPNSNIPLHPITAMQKAFAESLLEVTDGKPADKPKIRFGDGKARREKLISQERDDELHSARWRYRPNQQQHELQKLMAQISFGVYLLLNGMANSATQVVNILQGHIDEVDEFLEVAMEDFKQASDDLKERLDYLRLPMENMEVFEKLLEDRNFRLQIVEGNEKIEHIIARTNVQLEQYDKDVQQGLASAREFAQYLRQQQDGAWRQDRPDIVDIYQAMKGNTEGWFNAFVDLQAQGQDLNALVVRLSHVVAEMSSKAGEVSRKTWTNIPPFSAPKQAAKPTRDGPFMSPHSSMSSPKSASRSTLRANSLSGSAASTSQPSSQLSSQPEYFDLPIKQPEIAVASGRQSPAISAVNQGRAALESDYSSDTRSASAIDGDSDDETTRGMEDAPIFLLQPRTYTPQPPEPLPSPMVREDPREEPREEPESTQQGEQQPLTKQTSLRQRTQPPEAIQIPPPPPAEYQRPPSSSTWRAGTPDSNNGPDDQQRSRYGSVSEASPPVMPSVMASSPRSDHQFYRPVQASPHSPLQQRPQTAGASPLPRYPVPSSYHPGHERNAPSRMGGASMLSNVTTMTYDSQATETTKKLKKKRSALGWLKKAFSLDEEERMAYEARKQQQSQNLYYDERSPKFLDGRRVRLKKSADPSNA